MSSILDGAMVHNFKKRPKKTDAPSNNIANVPHFNVSPLTTKATRLKGENMVHRWNNNTMCTQSHAYPLWKIYVEQSIEPLRKFQNSTNPPFHMKFHVKIFQPFENHFKLHVNFTRGKPLSDCKYWPWFFKNITKCFDKKTIWMKMTTWLLVHKTTL